MKKNKINRCMRFFVIFFIALLVCLFIGGTFVKSQQKLETSQMERLVLTKSNKLNEILSKLLYKTQTLSVIVVQNNGNIQDFEQLAATIVDDPSIKNIIIAPDGVVSHVFPLEGNEAVIGFDYFSESAGNVEAIKAKETGNLILGGPFNLVQGGQALVGRLPVYTYDDQQKQKFWGIVSVTLNYPQALDGVELDVLEDQGFAYEIWRINPDTNQRQVIASNSFEYNEDAGYVEKEVNLFNAQWFFRIAPIREWYQYPSAWFMILLGLFISFLIAFLSLHNYDLTQMRKELENLSEKDFLTSALNRRGLFHLIEDLINTSGNAFCLAYIDLNKFKSINDTYGHNAGDKVLRYFTHVLLKHIEDGQVVARIGGDEFIVLFPNTSAKESTGEFFEKIHNELETPVPVNKDTNIPISLSIGFALYPDDGTTVDELIGVADEAMYTKKRDSFQET